MTPTCLLPLDHLYLHPLDGPLANYPLRMQRSLPFPVLFAALWLVSLGEFVLPTLLLGLMLMVPADHVCPVHGP